MAISSLNTKLEVELTANVWTEIAEIIDLDLTGITVDIEETTSLNSGDFKEFAAGYNDAGSLNVNLLFSRTSYQLFYNSIIAKAKYRYRIVMPDMTTFLFTGIVTALPFGARLADAVKINLAIKISGTFALQPTTPVVYTIPVIEIARYTAKFTWSIDSQGSAPVTDAGWLIDIHEADVLNRTASPYNPYVMYPTPVTNGSFDPNTKYYYCAYATNSYGTVYGSVLNFTTLP